MKASFYFSRQAFFKPLRILVLNCIIFKELSSNVLLYFYTYCKLLHVRKSQSFNIYAALITRATGTGNSYTLIN